MVRGGVAPYRGRGLAEGPRKSRRHCLDLYIDGSTVPPNLEVEPSLPAVEFEDRFGARPA